MRNSTTSRWRTGAVGYREWVRCGEGIGPTVSMVNGIGLFRLDRTSEGTYPRARIEQENEIHQSEVKHDVKQKW